MFPVSIGGVLGKTNTYKSKAPNKCRSWQKTKRGGRPCEKATTSSPVKDRHKELSGAVLLWLGKSNINTGSDLTRWQK